MNVALIKVSAAKIVGDSAARRNQLPNTSLAYTPHLTLRLCWRRALVVATSLIFAALPAPAQQLDRDTSEAVLKVSAKTKDRYNNVVEGELTVTTFKPPGVGPFPLVIVNHGRGDVDERAALLRPRFSAISRYFVRKGFVVAVPLRFGYGNQQQGDPEEASPSCDQSRHDVAFSTAADQILAVANHMQRQPFVDPDKLIIVGHSVGGFSSLAAGALNPTGLLATINFAGGKGGSPEKRPGEPCGSALLSLLAAKYGAATSAKRSLWLYSANDMYFNLSNATSWHKAYNSAGGQAKLLALPPHGKDGHGLMLFGADVWQPLLDKYLAELGFDRPGVIETPPPTDFAALADSSALPHIAENPKAKVAYANYLAAPEPKAFAIGPLATWGIGAGDDALSKALAGCQRVNGAVCKLYAVNSKVVWAK
ncbi:MAG: prolyl oligopeptidase family serine peptidase [Burkholderiaceae bacterium]|nr:prolyl oligopeptidase family serine peptidase [Burkholderiaceae bacterium]